MLIRIDVYKHYKPYEDLYLAYMRMKQKYNCEKLNISYPNMERSKEIEGGIIQ